MSAPFFSIACLFSRRTLPVLLSCVQPSKSYRCSNSFQPMEEGQSKRLHPPNKNPCVNWMMKMMTLILLTYHLYVLCIHISFTVNSNRLDTKILCSAHHAACNFTTIIVIRGRWDVPLLIIACMLICLPISNKDLFEQWITCYVSTSTLTDHVDDGYCYLTWVKPKGHSTSSQRMRGGGYGTDACTKHCKRFVWVRSVVG